MQHIAVNLTNVSIITLSAGVGLGFLMFFLIWLREHDVPVLSPIANALLQFAPHLPKS